MLNYKKIYNLSKLYSRVCVKAFKIIILSLNEDKFLAILNRSNQSLSFPYLAIVCKMITLKFAGILIKKKKLNVFLRF